MEITYTWTIDNSSIPGKVRINVFEDFHYHSLTNEADIRILSDVDEFSILIEKMLQRWLMTYNEEIEHPFQFAGKKTVIKKTIDD